MPERYAGKKSEYICRFMSVCLVHNACRCTTPHRLPWKLNNFHCGKVMSCLALMSLTSKVISVGTKLVIGRSTFCKTKKMTIASCSYVFKGHFQFVDM